MKPPNSKIQTRVECDELRTLLEAVWCPDRAHSYYLFPFSHFLLDFFTFYTRYFWKVYDVSRCFLLLKNN